MSVSRSAPDRTRTALLVLLLATATLIALAIGGSRPGPPVVPSAATAGGPGLAPSSPDPSARGLTPTLYEVNFTRTGLPNGTLWSVTMSGDSISTGGAYLVFDEPNGSDYEYQVTPPSGYTTSPLDSYVNVTGRSVRVLVAFLYAALPPSVFLFQASPAVTNAGSPVELVATVFGGSPPLAFSFERLPPGCNSSNAPRISCTPTEAGNYSIEFTVRDHFARTAMANLSLEVYPAPPPSNGSGPAPSKLLGLPVASAEILLVGLGLGVALIAIAIFRIRRPPSPPVEVQVGEWELVEYPLPSQRR